MVDLAISPVNFSERVDFDQPSKQGVFPADMLISEYGPRQTLAVTATATTSGSRPIMPAGFTHVLLTATKGVVVDVGSNPTASATSGVDIVVGAQMVLPINSGHLLSAIEA